MRADLVILVIGGVQRFIAQSRKTEDAAGASWVIRDIVVAAAQEVRSLLADESEPYGLVFPVPAALDASEHFGVTSKLTALTRPGQGRDVGAAAARAVRDRWSEMVRLGNWPDGPPVQDPPGAPEVVWVSVTGDTDYTDLWRKAQAALTSRRRARAFEPRAWRRSDLCAQTPSLPAQPAPRNSLRVEREEKLSVVGWIKRLYGRRQAREDLAGTFPSTTVIASSSFRQSLLRVATETPAAHERLAALATEFDAVLDGLHDRRRHWALPGTVASPLKSFSDRLGTAISPDAWEEEALRSDYGENFRPELAGRGQRAAVQARGLAVDLDIPRLTPYYAVIVHDLDRLGRTVGELDLAQQREASAALLRLARTQRDLLRDTAAVPVYAGGDDFLAFSPAADALTIAARLRVSVTTDLADGPLAGVTASTAVVFAHMTDRLRDTIAIAQDALKTAKETRGRGGRERDALTVVVLRRGGERARAIVPWYPPAANGRTIATTLLATATPRDVGLSARLAAKLEADRFDLDSLAARPDLWPVLRLELARLVKRQGGTADVADALYALGLDERSNPDLSFQPVPAALVARFLAQECAGIGEREMART